MSMSEWLTGPMDSSLFPPGSLSRRWMSPPEPPEDDPPEVCEECDAVVQDTAAVDRECWRCGEAL